MAAWYYGKQIKKEQSPIKLITTKQKTKVSVRFQKVTGHSGDKYNDYADKLAKQALGLG